MTVASMIIERIHSPMMYALGGGTYATAYIVGRALRAYGSSRPDEKSYPSIVNAIKEHETLKNEEIPTLQEILFHFDSPMAPWEAKDLRASYNINRLWAMGGREAVEKYHNRETV